jgi:hypothetical protein
MQCLAAPAGSFQDCRSKSFDRPIHDFVVLILYIQKNLAVRIGPEEFRHGALEGDGMLHVVIRPAVVRERWDTNEQKANQQTKTDYSHIFHAAPLGTVFQSPVARGVQTPAALMHRELDSHRNVSFKILYEF